jgi:hypothetical protein
MNLLKKGFNTPMAMKGFRTSDCMASLSSDFGDEVNNASKSYNSILSDRTRTRSEKTPLLAKAQKKHLKALESAFIKANEYSMTSAEAFMAKEDEARKYSGNESVLILMAQQLATSDKPIELVNSDPRYFQTMATLPPAFFGMSKDGQEAALASGLRQHYPELVEEREQVIRDRDHISKLAKALSDANKDFTGAIDHDAAGTRVDETTI